MPASVSRLFIGFHLLAVVCAVFFWLSPVLFLVSSPLLGVLALRVCMALWQGTTSVVFQECKADVLKGWYCWGALSGVALYCVLQHPGALVLAPLSLEIADAFWLKSSVFKPIGLVMFVGFLQLEALMPRSIVASYWSAFRAQSLPFSQWMRVWNKAHPGECVQGLLYVLLIYTVSVLCPVLTFAAVALLLHYYTWSCALVSAEGSALSLTYGGKRELE